MVTALALDYFSRQKIDIAVIETGLGGRLDATNVLSPELTIITDINYDHKEILGDTLTLIAAEKAGIIKPGTPTLTGKLLPAADRVIREHCKQKNSYHFKITGRLASTNGHKSDFRYNAKGYSIDKIRLALPGEHQRKNGALVVEAARHLQDRGWRISKKAVREGLATTEWAGRFQIIDRDTIPLTILDVCHNPSGVAAFVRTFKERFPHKKCHIILGLVKRKDHQAIVNILSEIASDFALVPLKTRRSTDINQLAASLNWYNRPLKVYGRLKTGFNKLLKNTSHDDIIGVIGSHYLIGEFLKENRIK